MGLPKLNTGIHSPDFVDRMVAGVRRQLNAGARSTEAQQLRQMLLDNPQLRTMTSVRDFLVTARPEKYRTAELDSVAQCVVGWQIQYDEDFPAYVGPLDGPTGPLRFATFSEEGNTPTSPGADQR